MAFHVPDDRWSPIVFSHLQASWPPVAINAHYKNGFVNRWSGVQIPHPAPIKSMAYANSSTSACRTCCVLFPNVFNGCQSATAAPCNMNATLSAQNRGLIDWRMMRIDSEGLPSAAPETRT